MRAEQLSLSKREFLQDLVARGHTHFESADIAEYNAQFCHDKLVLRKALRSSILPVLKGIWQPFSIVFRYPGITMEDTVAIGYDSAHEKWIERRGEFGPVSTRMLSHDDARTELVSLLSAELYDPHTQTLFTSTGELLYLREDASTQEQVHGENVPTLLSDQTSCGDADIQSEVFPRRPWLELKGKGRRSSIVIADEEGFRKWYAAQPDKRFVTRDICAMAGLPKSRLANTLRCLRDHGHVQYKGLNHVKTADDYLAFFRAWALYPTSKKAIASSRIERPKVCYGDAIIHASFRGTRDELADMVLKHSLLVVHQAPDDEQPRAAYIAARTVTYDKVSNRLTIPLGMPLDEQTRFTEHVPAIGKYLDRFIKS